VVIVKVGLEIDDNPGSGFKKRQVNDSLKDIAIIIPKGDRQFSVNSRGSAGSFERGVTECIVHRHDGRIDFFFSRCEHSAVSAGKLGELVLGSRERRIAQDEVDEGAEPGAPGATSGSRDLDDFDTVGVAWWRFGSVGGDEDAQAWRRLSSARPSSS